MLAKVRSRLTYANVMSSLAVFLVLTGGTAVALSGSNTVFSDDITNGEVKNPDIASGSVGTGKVIDESLTGQDVKLNSVGGIRIVNNSLTPLDIANVAALAGSRRRVVTCPSKDGTGPKVTLLKTEAFEVLGFCGVNISAPPYAVGIIDLKSRVDGAKVDSLEGGGQTVNKNQEAQVLGVPFSGTPGEMTSYSAIAPNGQTLSGEVMAGYVDNLKGFVISATGIG